MRLISIALLVALTFVLVPSPSQAGAWESFMEFIDDLFKSREAKLHGRNGTSTVNGSTTTPATVDDDEKGTTRRRYKLISSNDMAEAQPPKKVEAKKREHRQANPGWNNDNQNQNRYNANANQQQHGDDLAATIDAATKVDKVVDGAVKKKKKFRSFEKRQAGVVGQAVDGAKKKLKFRSFEKRQAVEGAKRKLKFRSFEKRQAGVAGQAVEGAKKKLKFRSFEKRQAGVVGDAVQTIKKKKFRSFEERKKRAAGEVDKAIEAVIKKQEKKKKFRSFEERKKRQANSGGIVAIKSGTVQREFKKELNKLRIKRQSNNNGEGGVIGRLVKKKKFRSFEERKKRQSAVKGAVRERL